MKNKAATDGGERRAHRGVRRSLFAQDDDELFVTGSTLYAGGHPPGHNPLVITPFSAAVGHRRTEPRGYTRTPDTIRPTIGGHDLNRPTNDSKQGGYDLWGFSPGVWSDTAGDNRRQQNRI